MKTKQLNGLVNFKFPGPLRKGPWPARSVVHVFLLLGLGQDFLSLFSLIIPDDFHLFLDRHYSMGKNNSHKLWKFLVKEIFALLTTNLRER